MPSCQVSSSNLPLLSPLCNVESGALKNTFQLGRCWWSSLPIGEATGRLGGWRSKKDTQAPGTLGQWWCQGVPWGLKPYQEFISPHQSHPKEHTLDLHHCLKENSSSSCNQVALLNISTEKFWNWSYLGSEEIMRPNRLPSQIQHLPGWRPHIAHPPMKFLFAKLPTRVHWPRDSILHSSCSGSSSPPTPLEWRTWAWRQRPLVPGTDPTGLGIQPPCTEEARFLRWWWCHRSCLGGSITRQHPVAL